MYQLIELLAVVSGAIYGVMLARQHKMDICGAFSLGLIIAFGGGTLRDLFLDRFPLFWIREDHYPVIVFAIALVASFFPQLTRLNERWLVLPDALGLGLFSIVGATAAIEAGTSMFVASILGVVTGTFGGVIGEVICNQVPSLFRTAPLYATCSFVGCWTLFVFNGIGVPEQYAAGFAIAVVVAFRLAAVARGWTLPQIDGEERLSSDDG